MIHSLVPFTLRLLIFKDMHGRIVPSLLPAPVLYLEEPPRRMRIAIALPVNNDSRDVFRVYRLPLFHFDGKNPPL